ncbi:GATA zinc finger-domain-containing protein [Zychaea mexicana]|uniref:GATA zinc finger-domain-containing protein n=1 Tax=Zychaea mexicana TaxID=64656 RepID=UPI0022FECAFC|nr:GATA zinc finger-domain-containing protein [Zychaea mexicana]KAI9493111.1 GATA zinc finger-domain-containing protein [Zychaea mexicana]
MVGIQGRDNSQPYMSINQLLCSQTCKSVELERAVDRKVQTHYIYTHFPRGISMRICAKCHTSKSPEWRRGPSGDKTLCNACGLRFSRLIAKQRRMSSIQRH